MYYKHKVIFWLAKLGETFNSLIDISIGIRFL